ncbi:adenosylcobinamide-GDP ribazoletransferase [Sulfurimonas sp. SAG-AH-194-I05]|nr:adenosylcobinamide-GDP ribazoletransferase [Sulfurimonas sp. SAG-AH-194-I05]MDF1875252.1 adenosylcobinamide-GDP ribazoletransferase [Sulfurimonas sp. SAG-AH-194-I05]
MLKLLKAFALSLNMLSIIPFFKVHTFYKGINGYSAMFYPFVGFILGSILFLIHMLLEPLLPLMHLSVLIFALWILITGGLHLDGLSDTIDGLFVHKDKALQIMKDPHVGGMGMIFTFTFLLLKLSSVIHFELFYFLPFILMYSRFNAVLALYFFPYISNGVGKLLKEELHFPHMLFGLIFTLFLAYYASFIGAFFVCLFILLLVGSFFKARLGGFNGDMYGFLIEVTEVALLNYVILTQLT